MDTLTNISNGAGEILTQYSQGFQFAFALLCGGFALPIAKWIHSKLPGEFPIQEPVYAVALCFGCAWILELGFHHVVDIERLIALACEGFTAGYLWGKGQATVKGINLQPKE